MPLRNLIVAVTLLAIGPAPFANSRSQVKPTPSGPHVMVAPEEIVWQPIPPAWADGPPPNQLFTNGQTVKLEITVKTTQNGVQSTSTLGQTWTVTATPP